MAPEYSSSHAAGSVLPQLYEDSIYAIAATLAAGALRQIHVGNFSGAG